MGMDISDKWFTGKHNNLFTRYRISKLNGSFALMPKVTYMMLAG